MKDINLLTKPAVLLGLGAMLAFGQATGTQAPASSSTKAHTGNHSPDHGMNSNQGAGVMVGKPDEEFMMKAAQGGMAEIEAARIAQEKATSNEVKEFARKIEQDHTKAGEQLKQLAAQKNVSLPTDAGAHRAALDKVKAKSGDDFDKAWLKMMAGDHKKDVSEFQKETDRAMDSDVRSFASATLPTLQDHLKTVQELQGSMRGRSAGSAKQDSSSTPKSDNNPTTKQ